LPQGAFFGSLFHFGAQEPVAVDRVMDSDGRTVVIKARRPETLSRRRPVRRIPSVPIAWRHSKNAPTVKKFAGDKYVACMTALPVRPQADIS
jgi:hypothetical protein